MKVSDLLRKCKILAYRLGNDDFKSWVENELNGYPKDIEVEMNSNPIPQDKVSQIFNIEIKGDVGNLASSNYQSTINQKFSNGSVPQEFLELLTKLKDSNIEDEIALKVANKLEILGASVGTSEYKNLYSELMGFVSNHITVLGFLAPYIPMLTSYLN